MKILHIQVLPKLSGVQRVSLEIFRNLPKEYEKTILFSESTDCGDLKKCIKEFEATGAKILFSKNLKREISPISDLKAIIEIYQLCRKNHFDIVHTNSTKPGIVGRVAARLAGGAKIVHTVHGLSFHKFIKFPQWQFYWLCEMFASFFSHKITIVNKYYLKYFRFFKTKTYTIYNGLDFSKFPSESLSRTNNKNNVKILFVGRLDNQKNPLMLLQTAKNICEVYPTTKFTMVGDGELMQECRDYISKNNLANNVTLTGWSNDTSKYYATHDIFAMPSRYEAFGLIFLEAGFYYLPIVATNVEGIPEVVIDGKTGLLCPPTEISAFEKNIMKLIENPIIRTDMGKQAHARVTGEFDSKKMVTQYLAHYKSLLDGHH